LKFEGRHVDPRSGAKFESAVPGIEYGFGPVFGTPYQASLLAEYNWDSRSKADEAALWQNDLFLGTRVDFSNTAGTNLFIGRYLDLDYGGTLDRVTLETRLSDTLLLNVEGLFANVRDKRDTLYNARQIDQLSVNLRWSF
jgi:hypothetical protein